MILISHRGNLNGKTPDRENSPTYIQDALDKGFDVEIDVWFKGGKWFLGHDLPQYPVDITFLLKKGLWCHAKNIAALEKMIIMGVHCFWHQEDDVTITSKGYLWTYPGRELTNRSICVLPEQSQCDILEAKGICSDYIEAHRED